ncbi:hypothetical protein NL154_05660 [Rhizobium sp. YTUHZ044]|uniref:hypothetical protein n=1 Tax=Rhizobium sp. YTUHZ044 TaxID=2962678 RepID=UPI003DA9E5E9
MRQRFCRQCSEWHEVDEWPIGCFPSAPPAQSDALPVPMFISDTMDPTEHVDGNFYSSKSQFRAVTRAHGLVEVGNDPARLKPRTFKKTTRTEIKESVQKAAARYRAGERA